MYNHPHIKTTGRYMKYYYNLEGKNNGPVTLEELQALVEKGVIQPHTPVIESGKKEWMRWEKMAQTLGVAAKLPKKPTRLAFSAAPQLRPTLQPTAAPAPQAAAAPASQETSFIYKIASVYDKVDAMFAKVCRLPERAADSPEYCVRMQQVLSSIVGVGTLMCVLMFCLANGLYESIKLLGTLLLFGAVLQYICYQMYCAMAPLLLGRKIKLSSMGMPRTLAILCAVGILVGLYLLVQTETLSDAASRLMIILLLAGMGYAAINAPKLFVTIVPEEVAPGREMINHVRFIIRVFIIALHALTPILMLLALISFMANGQEGFEPSGSLMGMLGMAVELGRKTPIWAFVVAVLPVLNFIGFCLISLIPDMLDAIFAAGDHKNS